MRERPPSSNTGGGGISAPGFSGNKMDELTKIFTDGGLSLAARGLVALAVAMPADWKYRWTDLVQMADCNEAEIARRELVKFGINLRDISSRLSVYARDKYTTTSDSISISGEINKKNESSSARTRTDGRALACESYPETPEEVVAAAAARAYLMSLEEAANFIAFYGSAGWRMKDDRPIRNWVCLLDRWKIGQTREQYCRAQEEQRRRRQGIAPDVADDMVTLETGERWPKSDAVYLDEYDVWVKASGAC